MQERHRVCVLSGRILSVVGLAHAVGSRVLLLHDGVPSLAGSYSIPLGHGGASRVLRMLGACALLGHLFQLMQKCPKL